MLHMKMRVGGATGASRPAFGLHRPARCQHSVVTRASKQEQVLAGPALLAVMVALSGGLTAAPAIYPPPAFADATETEDDANLSPYVKRQREMEKRRELLRQAREKAEQAQQGGASEAASATAKADEAVDNANAARRVEAERSVRKLNVQSYESQAAKSFKPPASSSPSDNDSSEPAAAPAAAPKFELPKFSFGLPKADKAPEAPKVDTPAQATKAEAPKYVPPPSVPTPPPAPAPRAVPMPIPVPVPTPTPTPATPVKVSEQQAKAAAKSEEQAKKSEESKKSNKRRGPLPMFLAQLLVLGMFVGVGAAGTKYNEQSAKAIDEAGKVVKGLYQKVEAAVAKQ